MSLLAEELHSLTLLLARGVRASLAFDKSIQAMRMEEAATRMRMVQATAAAKRQLRAAAQQSQRTLPEKRKDTTYGGRMD